MSKTVIYLNKDLKELIPSFMNLTGQDFHSMQEAIQSSDIVSILRIAHTLKGDFGNYGFDELSHLSAELENVAKKGQWDEIKNTFSKIEDIFNQIEIRFE